MSDSRLAASAGSRTGLWIRRGAVSGIALLIAGGTAFGLVGMGAVAPHPHEKEEVVEALPVLTTYAKSENVTLSVLTQGEVVARSVVNLSSQVSGRISYASPAFLAGGAFRQGDVLFRLDPREYELRVVQAKANVAQARTTLEREMSEAEVASVDARELGIENVSDLALRRPQVAEAEARLASAQANLSEADLNLSRTVVRAPFTGRVRSKAVDLGTYVSPGTPLGVVYSTEVAEVPIALTDEDLSRLDLSIGFSATRAQPGPKVMLRATIGGQPYEWVGEITRSESGFDPETRVLFAYAEVRDPFGAGADRGTPLATGLYVSAEIEGRPLDGAVTVPRTALRGTDTIYVVAGDDSLEIREVVVASSDRQRAVISSGLSEGERVVTSPVRSPADGMKVKPVDQADARSEKNDLIATAETAQLED